MNRRGFVAFGDRVGLASLARFAGDCVAVVVDPSRLDPAAAADMVGSRPPVFTHPPTGMRETFLAELRGLAPVLGISVSYSRILWPELLDLFPHGVVNLHNGKLPAYRGANVLQWAIINGETETAATLHRMDGGIDTGPVIAAAAVPIHRDDSARALRDRLCAAGDRLLDQWVPRLLAESVPGTPQAEVCARTWPPRRPEDGKIDWSRTDEDIYHLVRALLPPWPGAWYTAADGSRAVIDRMLTVEEIRVIRQKARR